MRWPVHERVAGTTFKGTWKSGADVPSLITSALINSDGTVVDSIAAVSSGTGSYYSLHTLPTSPGPYVNEWRAWINSRPYVNRQLVRVFDLEA